MKEPKCAKIARLLAVVVFFWSETTCSRGGTREAYNHGPHQARRAGMCRPGGGAVGLGAGACVPLRPPLPSCVCALYPGHTPRPRPCKHPDTPPSPVQTAEESLAQHILLAASKMAPAEGAAKGRYASVRGLLLFPAPPHIAHSPAEGLRSSARRPHCLWKWEAESVAEGSGAGWH